MRNVSKLITQVRRETENTSFNASGSTGITDAEFLQYLNDAQNHLQALIQQAHVRFFDATTTISLVANTTSYTLPAQILYFHRVVKVEYSYDGQEVNYIPIPEVEFRAVSTQTASNIGSYSLSDRTLITNGSPSTSQGTLRVTYTKYLPTLDSSRGSVSSTTNDGTDYTTIVLTGADDTELSNAEYVSVVDWDGTTIYNNIPVSSYDSGTSTLTLRSGVALSAGTIAAGNTLVSGQFASTHSSLPAITERYLIAYASWKIFKRDSSTDSAEAFQELQMMEDDILKSLARPTDAFKVWSNTNPSFRL